MDLGAFMTSSEVRSQKLEVTGRMSDMASVLALRSVPCAAGILPTSSFPASRSTFCSFYRKLTANHRTCPRHLAQPDSACRNCNRREPRRGRIRVLAARPGGQDTQSRSRGSRECHYWLRLVRSRPTCLTPSRADPLIDECHQLIAMLTTAVRKLRSADRSPTGRRQQAPSNF